MEGRLASRSLHERRPAARGSGEDEELQLHHPDPQQTLTGDDAGSPDPVAEQRLRLLTMTQSVQGTVGALTHYH